MMQNRLPTGICSRWVRDLCRRVEVPIEVGDLGSDSVVPASQAARILMMTLVLALTRGKQPWVPGGLHASFDLPSEDPVAASVEAGDRPVNRSYEAGFA